MPDTSCAMNVNVHIYPSPLVNESRCFKITKALAEEGVFDRILMIGVAKAELPQNEAMDPVRSIRRLRRDTGRGNVAGKIFGTLKWYREVWRSLNNENVVCINAHSLSVLPLCVLLARRHKARLVYDTHELETETMESVGYRRGLAKFVERFFIHKADDVFCVSRRIAEWYRGRYGIRLPYVVRNIPDLSSAMPAAKGLLRERAGLPPEGILFIYLGGLARYRGIERMLRLFSNLPGTHRLIVIGDGSLRPLVEEAAEKHNNIHYLPPVDYREVVMLTADADIGISVIENTCLSHYYALSNKFFEYLQAGIPVLVGDLIEQREIVKQHQAGWELPEADCEAIRMLSEITQDEISLRKFHARSIREQYNWQNERSVLINAYRSMPF